VGVAPDGPASSVGFRVGVDAICGEVGTGKPDGAGRGNEKIREL
jgi:hypothetical protein